MDGRASDVVVRGLIGAEREMEVVADGAKAEVVERIDRKMVAVVNFMVELLWFVVSIDR